VDPVVLPDCLHATSRAFERWAFEEKCSALPLLTKCSDCDREITPEETAAGVTDCPGCLFSLVDELRCPHRGCEACGASEEVIENHLIRHLLRITPLSVTEVRVREDGRYQHDAGDSVGDVPLIFKGVTRFDTFVEACTEEHGDNLNRDFEREDASPEYYATCNRWITPILVLPPASTDSGGGGSRRHELIRVTMPAVVSHSLRRSDPVSRSYGSLNGWGMTLTPVPEPTYSPSKFSEDERLVELTSAPVAAMERDGRRHVRFAVDADYSARRIALHQQEEDRCALEALPGQYKPADPCRPHERNRKDLSTTITHIRGGEAWDEWEIEDRLQLTELTRQAARRLGVHENGLFVEHSLWDPTEGYTKCSRDTEDEVMDTEDECGRPPAYDFTAFSYSIRRQLERTHRENPQLTSRQVTREVLRLGTMTTSSMSNYEYESSSSDEEEEIAAPTPRKQHAPARVGSLVSRIVKAKATVGGPLTPSRAGRKL
jgi:hypothetical protein